MSRSLKQDGHLRGHSDKWDLVLVKQEAIALEAALEMGQRTARVHVIATYTDQNGTVYTADRIVKMRLKREENINNEINTSRTCTAALEYKTDGDGNLVVLECNRLHDHRGAHRGKYTEEVIRWK